MRVCFSTTSANDFFFTFWYKLTFWSKRSWLLMQFAVLADNLKRESLNFDNSEVNRPSPRNRTPPANRTTLAPQPTICRFHIYLVRHRPTLLLKEQKFICTLTTLSKELSTSFCNYMHYWFFFLIALKRNLLKLN